MGSGWGGEREILFSHETIGGLFRMPVSGGALPRRLSWVGEGSSPTIARSQHRLVYTQDRSHLNLWRVGLRPGGDPVDLGSGVPPARPRDPPNGEGNRVGPGPRAGVWT